jgi:hypothetical protein
VAKSRVLGGKVQRVAGWQSQYDAHVGEIYREFSDVWLIFRWIWLI